MRHILHNIYMIAAMLTVAMASSESVSASRPTVTASIDSTSVVQGSKAALKIEVLDESAAGRLVDMPELGKDYFGIEFSSLKVDTINHDNGPTEYVYNYVVQAFDPGTFTLPPFRYAVDSDTAQSSTVTLKVIEMDLDSLTDINPMESVVTIPSRWYDFIPDWWVWVALVIVLGGLGVAVYLLMRHKTIVLARPEKVIPPYDLAVMRLHDLQDSKLAQSGRDKDYYTELTDILRQYLEGRFGINALEMSSTQIIDTLRRDKETRPSADLMRQILEIADFVKFAKVRPLPDDNIKSFNSAVKFVEDSKPIPEPEEGAEGTDNENKTSLKK